MEPIQGTSTVRSKLYGQGTRLGRGGEKKEQVTEAVQKASQLRRTLLQRMDECGNGALGG